MLRLIGNLLLIVAVTVGALSASTAYVVPLSLPADQLQGLTLNADAGIGVGGAPLAGQGDTLTAELVAQLKVQSESEDINVDGRHVTRVQVQEFSFAHWTGKWFFILAIVALIAGGFLVKNAQKKEIEEAHTIRQDSGESPEDALAQMRETIAGLKSELPGMASDEERCHAIVERIGILQRDQVQIFVDGRTMLVADLGLSGFAALMDRFAAAERQINRAWSAAADGAVDEAMACIERAGPFFEQTAEKMLDRPV